MPLNQIKRNKEEEVIKELSVIVPVFNGQRTLKECLNGIFSQNYYPKKFEVVVVNDGSTDKTAEISKEFPVRLINLPKNKGRIAARNIAVDKAKFKYLLFIDSDCIPDKTWIYETLKHKYYPVQGQVLNTMHRAIDRFFYLVRKRYYRPLNKPTFITPQIFFRFPKGLGNFLVKKDLYKKIKFRDTGELFSDDQYFIYELGKYRNVLAIPETIVHADERPTIKALFKQWFQRGSRFADFYLKKGGILEKEFYIYLVLSVIILLIFIFTTLEVTYLLTFYLIAGSVIILFLIFYLSEEKKDFFIVSFYIFPVVTAFILGLFYRKFICRK